MVSTSKNILNQKKQITPVGEQQSLWSKYMSYAESKDEDRIFWYMNVVITIPCVFMVGSIVAMSYLTPDFIWFVALGMLMFFTNVILHISEAKAKLFVPVYQATIAIMTIIPFLTYLMTL